MEIVTGVISQWSWSSLSLFWWQGELNNFHSHQWHFSIPGSTLVAFSEALGLVLLVRQLALHLAILCPSLPHLKQSVKWVCGACNLVTSLFWYLLHSWSISTSSARIYLSLTVAGASLETQILYKLLFNPSLKLPWRYSQTLLDPLAIHIISCHDCPRWGSPLWICLVSHISCQCLWTIWVSMSLPDWWLPRPFGEDQPGRSPKWASSWLLPCADIACIVPIPQLGASLGWPSMQILPKEMICPAGPSGK